MKNKDIFKIVNIVMFQIGLIVQSKRRERYQSVNSLALQLTDLSRSSDVVKKGARFKSALIFETTIKRFAAKLDEFVKAANFYISGESYRKALRMPTYREIFEDIKHLSDEFDIVEYDARNKQLSVTTENIELEGINFGEFKISLDLLNLGELKLHKIICVEALQPNPAACNHEVTHPHVQNERMCCGDGTVPMTNALENGRLLDFFMVAAQVLRTYNSSSPYVSLDMWDGIECYNCGSVTSEGNSYYCERCDHEFCDDCMTYCECCGKRVCRDCIRTCECGKRICDECFNNMECNCHESDSEGDNAEEAGIEVQPLCVGEADVHA